MESCPICGNKKMSLIQNYNFDIIQYYCYGCDSLFKDLRFPLEMQILKRKKEIIEKIPYLTSKLDFYNNIKKSFESKDNI